MTHQFRILVTHLGLALLGLAAPVTSLPAITHAPEVAHHRLQAISHATSASNNRVSSIFDSPLLAKRNRRSTDHIITECITVASEEGQYFFKGDTGGEACGLYLLTDPDRRVRITLDYLDIPCAHGGLVALFDGWELNRELFPAEGEHPLPLRDRILEFCSGSESLDFGAAAVTPGGGLPAPRPKLPKRVLISNQNAALVQFRVPQRSRGFAVTVRFTRNPTPCNILLEGTVDVYTIRNYGKAVNCSLATLFPARVTVLSLSVGMSSSKRNSALETGTIHKCGLRGLPDYVEVGGSEGLDTRRLSIADSICGLDSKPVSSTFDVTQPKLTFHVWLCDVKVLHELAGAGQAASAICSIEETILCGVTTVRLVSSGGFDNAVTVALQPATEQDFADVICGM